MTFDEYFDEVMDDLLEEREAHGPFFPRSQNLKIVSHVFGDSVDDLTPEKYELIKSALAFRLSLKDLKSSKRYLETGTTMEW